MKASAVACLAIALLPLAATVAEASAQTPVVTLTASTNRIAERLVLTRTSSTPTLSTTTTTTRTTTTTSTTSTLPATNSATLTVTRTGTSLTDLTVRYSVSGTALNGKDYSSLGGTVTIPRSSSTATITIAAIDDAEDELDETIVVSLTSTSTSPYVLNNPASATITIVDDDDVRLAGLDIVTDSILAGSPVDVRVRLSGAAPTGGTTVSLTANNAAVSPPTITVAAGTRDGIGQIRTTDLSSPVSVVVQASVGGTIQRDTLVLYPAPRVTSVTLSRAVVFGGVGVTGTVTLESPAPPIVSGIDLRARTSLLTASRTTVGTGSLSPVPTGTLTSPPVTIPSTVPLAPGATTATFSVQTDVVSTTANVELTALIGSSSARAPLAIHPPPSIASSTFDPNPVEGGETVTWTIQLDTPIPTGLSWNPSVSSSSIAVSAGGTGGANVRFGAGASQWTGTLSTRPVPNRETACLRMPLPGGSFASGGCLTVLPPAITAFSANRDTYWGGAPVSGSITSARAVGGGYPVRITISVLSPAGAASPIANSRVIIPTGETTTAWNLSTSGVTVPTTVEIRAEGGVTDTVTLHPVPSIASSTFEPNPVEGGAAVTWTIQLDTPIPAGLSWNPSVSSSSIAVAAGGTGGANVRFGAGSSQWTGTLSTRPVPNRESACLRMPLPGGSFASGGCLTVLPPAITAFSANRDTYWGGAPVSGSITSARAVGGGYPVRITISVLSPAGAAPPIANSRVTIPTGETTTAWNLSTSGVTVPTTVEIRAEGGVTDTVTLHPVPSIALSTFSPNPVEGGTGVTWTVELDTPIPAGLSWNPAVSSTSSAISAGGIGGANVRFGAGASQWTGTLSTRPVPNSESACLRMPLPGGSFASGGCLTLLPPAITAFSADRDAYWGGSPVSGSITSARAVGGGYPVRITVSVLSPAGAASPVANSRVIIPTGATTTTWSLSSSAVTVPTTIEIRAEGGTADTVTVHPAPVLQSVELSPDPTFGGDRVGVRIRLARPVPTGLTWNVTLIGSGGLLPAGSRTATFSGGAAEATDSLDTSPVTQQTTAQLIVQSANSAFPATVTLNPPPPPVPVSFQLQPGTAVGGATVRGTVLLDHAAPPGGTLITLSALSNIVQIPSTITVPAGARQAAFDIVTRTVSSTQFVLLDASANGGRAGAQLQVEPPPPTLTSLQLQQSSVTGGQQVIATVTISRGVAGGVQVDLASLSPGVATVPNSVYVNAGATTATFVIQTSTIGLSLTVQIEAKLGPDVLRQSLTVIAPPPDPVLSSFVVAPTGKIFAGTDIDLTATLDRNAASGGIQIQLGSSNRSVLNPPPALNIPQGRNTATLSIPTAVVPFNTTVTLDAILDGNRIQQSVGIVPQPIDRIQIQNTLQMNSTTQATLRLSQPAPAGGLTVPLVSSDPTAATVPQSITIPAGSTQASFPVQSLTVRQDTEVTITAGGGVATTTVRVRSR